MAETTKNDEPPDPSDREAFQQWLETKPPAWSAVIIGRAALRVLPFAFPHEERLIKGPSILLSVFRATAIARFAVMYSDRAIETAAKHAAAATSSAVLSIEDVSARSATHSANYAAFMSYIPVPIGSVLNAIGFT